VETAAEEGTHRVVCFPIDFPSIPFSPPSLPSPPSTSPQDLAARQKREAQTAKKNKSRNQKRGGMPTWLAEFFLLAMFGGFAFAIVALPEVISGLYRKADSFLLGLFQKK